MCESNPNPNSNPDTNPDSDSNPNPDVKSEPNPNSDPNSNPDPDALHANPPVNPLRSTSDALGICARSVVVKSK